MLDSMTSAPTRMISPEQAANHPMMEAWTPTFQNSSMESWTTLDDNSSAKFHDDFLEPDVTILAMEYPAYIAAMYFDIYFTPVIVIVGLVGNTISFLVMRRPQNRQISCCIYIAALALSDNIMILIAIYYYLWIQIYPGVGTYFLCQLTCHLYYCFGQFGACLIVATTWDRHVAVVTPLKKNTHCTPRRAKIVTAVVLTVFVLYNMPYFYTAKIFGGMCYSYGKGDLFSTIYSQFNTGLAFVPFIILVVLNIRIVLAVQASAKIEGKTGSGSTPDDPSGKDQSKANAARERQLVGMLVSVSVALLVLTSPEYINYVVFIIIDPLQSPLVYSIYFFNYILASRLFYVNNAINVFLYCLSGPRFRNDAYEIVFGYCCKKRAQ